MTIPATAILPLVSTGTLALCWVLAKVPHFPRHRIPLIAPVIGAALTCGLMGRWSLTVAAYGLVNGAMAVYLNQTWRQTGERPHVKPVITVTTQP